MLERPPRVTEQPPYVLRDACLESPPNAPLIAHRPGCDFAPASRFWRWPGNSVLVPSEPAGGSCHDDELWFPAPSADCAPAPIVHVGERGRAFFYAAEDRALPDGWATVVQVGVTELPIELTPAVLAEVDRVGGPRFALSMSVYGPVDLAALAPFAERLVALLVLDGCSAEECPEPLDLAALPPMPELRSLRFAARRRTVRHVDSLARHPRLAGLGLPALPPAEGPALGRLRGLRVLAVQEAPVEALRRLRGLQRAHVAGTAESVGALAGHPRLRSLVLQGAVSDEALRRAARLGSLRHLSIGLRGYSDAGARALRRATRLRTLLVRARGELDDDLEDRLSELPSLARHPTASVFVDVDEVVQPESAPWATTLCAQSGQDCAEWHPDPVDDEVEALLSPAADED